MVEEYNTRVIMYEHKKTGAQVMSVLAPEENNKVFGVVFRTPPSDSTGVPHILEHSVLCGSRLYPSKEPFVDLLKGSLQTFLNAFTYPDRTCYPVASTNAKDFYNLISVYLDAVLHPRAMHDELVLKQEGWHLELDGDKLSYKGVVFNEMKGVYSSPESLMQRATQQALFPDNTYGVDSGGDPNAITDLTFDGFKSFHSNFYHPSNARVFFYGDDDPYKRLELLDSFLKDFERPTAPADSSVQWQPKLQEPRRIVEQFPSAPGSTPKAMLTVNWVLNHAPVRPEDEMALAVMDHLLLGTPSSALRKRLTQSGLGESVAGGGLGGELLQETFSVGLKGVSPEDTPKVEQLVLDSIAEIAKEGFEQDAIDASINSVEFSLREFNTGSFPRGLSFMLGCMSKWIYDGSPTEGVRFEAALAALKERLAAGEPVFQTLLQKLIVENTHRVTVDMQPDPELEARRQAEEEEKLQVLRDSMDAEDLKRIADEARELQEAQEAEDPPEARAAIPRLSLEDLDRTEKEVPTQVEAIGDTGVPLLTHDLSTNGILYTDLALDVTGASMEDLELLPLLVRMLTESGTSELDEVALSRRIGTYTGGIGVSTLRTLKHKDGTISDPDDVVFRLVVRGKAVESRVPELASLLESVLLDAQLSNGRRGAEILREARAGLRSAVVSSGHSYAALRTGARDSLLGYVSELMGGVTYLQRLEALQAEAESDWPAVQARLERLRASIVRRGGLLINLTGNGRTLSAGRELAERLARAVPEGGASGEGFVDAWKSRRDELVLPMRNEGLVVPSQVNYVVKSARLFDAGEEVKGSSSVAARFLSNGYLWDKVRVIGGAYGGFGRLSGQTGKFSFMSYRDPNLKGTLDTYDGAGAYMKGAQVSRDDIEMAIIGAVGSLDSPMSPDQKGYTGMENYLIGESAEARQRWRDEVLGTSEADFRDLGERLERVAGAGQGAVTVVGSRAAIDRANQELPEEQRMEVVDVMADAGGAQE